jgi:aminoglycoside phosphotransferase (APT) family kinase protein
VSAPAPFADLSEAVLRAIIAEHGLHVSQISRLRSTGIINSIYALGDEFVLRVPKNEPEALSDTFTESVAAPTAWRAGVRTPRLIVFDETRTLLDVPYSIYERVHGETLGQLEEPAETAHAWVALGRDLAKLHGTVTQCEDPLGRLDIPARMDLQDELEWLASEGVLIPSHTRWLDRWLSRLRPAVFIPITHCFLHDDLQANNVMVTKHSHDYLAMIDWGDAGWGDPALDLAWMDLRAVPFAMKGYREVHPFEGDDTLEARVLWDQIMNCLHQLGKAARQGKCQASYVSDLLRFVCGQTDERFRRWIEQPKT